MQHCEALLFFEDFFDGVGGIGEVMVGEEEEAGDLVDFAEGAEAGFDGHDFDEVGVGCVVKGRIGSGGEILSEGGQEAVGVGVAGLGIESEEFIAGEFWIGDADAVEGEEADHFVEGHSFAVVAGVPAEEGDEVEEDFGEVAVFAEVMDEYFGEVGFSQADSGDKGGLFGEVELFFFVFEPLLETIEGDGGELGEGFEGGFGGVHEDLGTLADFFVAVAFAHFGSVEVLYGGEVGVGRAGVVEGFLQGEVVEGIFEVFLSAKDMGDVHGGVIDDDGEVVCGHTVGFADDKVLGFVGWEDDVFAEDLVAEAVLLDGHSEADDGGSVFGFELLDLIGGVLGAAVEEGSFMFFGLGASCGEFVGGFPGLVGEVPFDEVVDDGIVEMEALGLADEVGVIPMETEPVEVVEELATGLFGGASEVGVFDAEEELAAGVACEEPVEQSGAGPADVEVASG